MMMNDRLIFKDLTSRKRIRAIRVIVSLPLRFAQGYGSLTTASAANTKLRANN
jgi:hypothetical protein